MLVAATPCPLILAAPVAFIAGAAQAARRSILIKGGGPLEALARTHTVMFDKTGTLTVGGARLVAVETAPGEILTNCFGLRLAGAGLSSCRRCRHRLRRGGKGLKLQSPERARNHGIGP